MKSLAFYFQSVLWELFWHYLGITFGNFFINFINFYFFSTSLLEIYLWTPAFSFVIPPAFLRQFPWRTFTNYFQYLGKARCSEKKKKICNSAGGNSGKIPEQIIREILAGNTWRIYPRIWSRFKKKIEQFLKKLTFFSVFCFGNFFGSSIRSFCRNSFNKFFRISFENF